MLQAVAPIPESALRYTGCYHRESWTLSSGGTVFVLPECVTTRHAGGNERRSVADAVHPFSGEHLHHGIDVSLVPCEAALHGAPQPPEM
jgi:hypothetical protein